MTNHLLVSQKSSTMDVLQGSKYVTDSFKTNALIARENQLFAPWRKSINWFLYDRSICFYLKDKIDTKIFIAIVYGSSNSTIFSLFYNICPVLNYLYSVLFIFSLNFIYIQSDLIYIQSYLIYIQPQCHLYSV